MKGTEQVSRMRRLLVSSAVVLLAGCQVGSASPTKIPDVSDPPPSVATASPSPSSAAPTPAPTPIVLVEVNQNSPKGAGGYVFSDLFDIAGQTNIVIEKRPAVGFPHGSIYASGSGDTRVETRLEDGKEVATLAPGSYFLKVDSGYPLLQPEPWYMRVVALP